MENVSSPWKGKLRVLIRPGMQEMEWKPHCLCNSALFLSLILIFKDKIQGRHLEKILKFFQDPQVKGGRVFQLSTSNSNLLWRLCMGAY